MQTYRRGENTERNGIKAGLILIFKFCGETWSAPDGGGKTGVREAERREGMVKVSRERAEAAHNRFSNS